MEASATCLLVSAPGDSRLTRIPNMASSLASVAHAAGLSPTMADWKAIIDVNLVGSARLLAGIDPLVVDESAIVVFASQAAYMGSFVGKEAIDEILDDPLHIDFWSRLEPSSVGIVDQNSYGWSKRAVQRLALRYARA